MIHTVQTNSGQPAMYDTDGVDALIAGVEGGGGSGVTRNTHTHSASGALSITRAAADQDTRTVVNANATGFADNMNDRDVWHLTLVNGTANDYIADLSDITDWADPASTLTDTLDVYETTVATLLLRKIEGVVYGTLDVPIAGTAQPGAAAVRGSYISNEVTAPTVAASSLSTTPQTGDDIYLIAVTPGPSGAASVNFTAPAGATQIVDYAGNAFAPRFRIWKKTYAGEANWTFGADSAITRVAVVALSGVSTATAGTPTNAIDPTAVTSPGAGIGLTLAATNFGSGETWSAVPAGHTLLVNSNAATGNNSKFQIAWQAITAGSYDPGAHTFTAGANQFSSVAIAAT